MEKGSRGGGEMGQQSLIYSFIARGTMVLAEYTEFTGNFTTIASQCFQKLPATNNNFTYNCDGHTFNYLVYIILGLGDLNKVWPRNQNKNNNMEILKSKELILTS